jgi:hypothetical protein
MIQSWLQEEREDLRRTIRRHIADNTLDSSARGRSVQAALVAYRGHRHEFHTARGAWCCAYRTERKRAKRHSIRNGAFAKAWLPGAVKVLTTPLEVFKTTPDDTNRPLVVTFDRSVVRKDGM